MRAALYYLRVEAWCTVSWSRRPSWRILLLAGHHGVPCVHPRQLRGWRCRGRPFGGRPCADSRVPLTGGPTRHISGRGGVPSPHAPTASGMTMQCPEWSHRADGDGRDAPDVTAWPRASTE
jgi:hypothetical protein